MILLHHPVDDDAVHRLLTLVYQLRDDGGVTSIA
jgi:hypothetical protein